MDLLVGNPQHHFKITTRAGGSKHMTPLSPHIGTDSRCKTPAPYIYHLHFNPNRGSLFMGQGNLQLVRQTQRKNLKISSKMDVMLSFCDIMRSICE
jgi:hypothetical protein